MEKEYNFALKLLKITREELQFKMILQHDDNESNDECIGQDKECIYTDGACPNNGRGANHAGIGVFFGDNDPRNISSLFMLDNPTNNRAELAAILMALENSSKDNIEICSDSQYSISCITKWMSKWKSNGWKTANGKPVKNKDLIVNIDKELSKKRFISFRYVPNNDHKIPKDKRNKDHYGNYMADKLANEGIQ